MSRWTIGKKIAAGLLVLLIQAISVGLYALWRSAEASGRLTALESEYLPEAELAASVERELLNARINYIYFVTIQKPGALEQGRERFANAQREIPKLLAMIERTDHFAAIRPDAEQLSRSENAYEAVLERVIGVIERKRNHGPEFTALVNEWAAVGATMVDAAGKLSHQGIEVTEEWARQASRQRDTTALAFGCTAVSLIGIADILPHARYFGQPQKRDAGTQCGGPACCECFGSDRNLGKFAFRGCFLASSVAGADFGLERRGQHHGGQERRERQVGCRNDDGGIASNRGRQC